MGPWLNKRLKDEEERQEGLAIRQTHTASRNISSGCRRGHGNAGNAGNTCRSCVDVCQQIPQTSGLGLGGSGSERQGQQVAEFAILAPVIYWLARGLPRLAGGHGSGPIGKMDDALKAPVTDSAGRKVAGAVRNYFW